MHALKTNGQGRRGIASVLAMIFLSLFTVLSMSMAVSSTSSVEIAGAQHRGRIAYAAAESGLQFVTHLFASIDDLPSTDNPDVLDSELPALWEKINEHFVTLSGTANLEGQAVTIAEAGISLPAIRVPVETGLSYSDFTVTIAKGADARYMTVTSIGRYGEARRRIAMTFRLGKDTAILKYAVASRSALVVSSGSVVDGDLYSTWSDYSCGGEFVPNYVLDETSSVNGRLATMETQATWDATDLGQLITGDYNGVVYEAPPIADEFSADKFDTSKYKNPETEIRPGVKIGALIDLSTIPPDVTQNNVRFPPEDDGTPREFFDRPVYRNRTFDNIIIPTGYNPVFENCTFNRITYVDCQTGIYRSSNLKEYNPELPPDQQDFSNTLPIKGYWKIGNYWHNANSWPDDQSNNVMFTSCTFNGPVISGVPKDFFWTKNSLYFDGKTQFLNDYMPEASILAPNFNVNIGALSRDNSNSKLTGLVVGGLVDVRGEAKIDGTILSMFYPDIDMGVGRAEIRTNIGFFDDEEGSVPDDAVGTVHIKPNPDRMMPMGIVTRIVIKPQYGTLSE